jgi:hypothetical protein
MDYPLDPKNAAIPCALGSDGRFPEGCVDFCTGKDDDDENCVKVCKVGTFLPIGCREKACASKPRVCPDDPSMPFPLNPDNGAYQCVGDDDNTSSPDRCVNFCTGSDDDTDSSTDSTVMCKAGTLLPTGCRERCCGDVLTDKPTKSPTALPTEEPTASPIDESTESSTDIPIA